jgi:hypothetical protein
MKRNLKALGLALVATLALAAIAATGSSAEEGKEASFWAAEGAVKIDATGEGTQEFVTSIGTLQCHEEGEDPAVHGTAKYVGETTELTGESIEYTNCTVPGPFGTNFPITVDMNGCDLLFAAGTQTSATTAEGSVHIQCNGEAEITITIFKASSEPPHPEEDLRCTIHIPEQSPKGTVTYHDRAEGPRGGKKAITATADEVEVTETVTDANTIVCNHHTHEVAKYSGSFWAEATNGSEEFVDAETTVPPPPEEADFWAAEDAVKIDATGEGTLEIDSGIGSRQCHEEGEDPALHFTAKYIEETAELTGENIEYANCTAPGPFGTNFPTTTDMNGCDFLFAAGTTTSATTAEGSVRIECPEEKEITITMFKSSSEPPHPEEDLRCTFHIPAQSPKGTVTFHNGTGPNGKKAVTVTMDELEVTETVTDNEGGIVCTDHIHEIAKFSGSFWAEATNADEEYVDTEVTGTSL